MRIMKNFFNFIVVPTSQVIFKRSVSYNEVNLASRAQFRMSPNVYRQEKSYTAVVKNIFNASPSIKVLRLYVKEAGFSFKAGQWVDFHVPGIDDVTGYSMTSPPYKARQCGILDLAVKEGRFPPTHWVHTKCQEGEEVNIRVGGDFYYDPKSNTSEATADLLLIGGGVGVNPLVSILLEYCYLTEQYKKGKSPANPGKVHLLYSAKTEKDLIFMEEFSNMSKDHSSITCQYFVTGSETSLESNLETKRRRILKSDIKASIEALQKNNILCYICGPSNMTDDMANILLSLQVQDHCIKYEKWW